MIVSRIDAFVGGLFLSLALFVLTPNLAWWRRLLAFGALVIALAFLMASYQFA